MKPQTKERIYLYTTAFTIAVIMTLGMGMIAYIIKSVFFSA